MSLNQIVTSGHTENQLCAKCSRRPRLTSDSSQRAGEHFKGTFLSLGDARTPQVELIISRGPAHLATTRRAADHFRHAQRCGALSAALKEEIKAFPTVLSCQREQLNVRFEAASRALEAAATRRRERLGNSLLLLAGRQNIIGAGLWSVAAGAGPNVPVHIWSTSRLHQVPAQKGGGIKVVSESADGDW